MPPTAFDLAVALTTFIMPLSAAATTAALTLAPTAPVQTATNGVPDLDWLTTGTGVPAGHRLVQLLRRLHHPLR
jgi:hypothetical protein